LHERGLEDADHLLAVGVRGPQITAAGHPASEHDQRRPCQHPAPHVLTAHRTRWMRGRRRGQSEGEHGYGEDDPT